jgi:RNA polymerase sigma factor (sigma-70 family)
LATVHDDPGLMKKALAKPHPEPLCKCDRIVMLMKPFLLGIASPIARRHRKDPEDLLSVAIVQICQKFHQFKPELGFSPLTYFGHIAWRVMTDFASRDAIIMPSHCWKSKEHTRLLGKKAKGTKSLDQTIGFDSEGVREQSDSVSHVLADHREESPDVNASSEEAKKLIHDALEVINKRYADIVRARLAGETLAEIGARMNLTRERIRQLEDLAHRRLHKAIRDMIRNKNC